MSVKKPAPKKAVKEVKKVASAMKQTGAVKKSHGEKMPGASKTNRKKMVEDDGF